MATGEGLDSNGWTSLISSLALKVLLWKCKTQCTRVDRYGKESLNSLEEYHIL